MSDNINSKLWDAAKAGNEALVSQLIEQGAEVDWRDDNNNTALHYAAKGGDPPVVTHLLDSGWSLEARNMPGLTPLSVAAVNGNLETVKTLLLRGALIDTQRDDKETPLHVASLYRHTGLVQLLLQCGANQDIRNDNGKTAEEETKNYEIRAVFSKYKEKKKQSLLLQAIDEKNYDVAIILIFRGATFEGSEWSFERVRIRDSEYSAKCGITGECLFWVSKGFIKITQVDNKTSVSYSFTKIRCIAAFFIGKKIN